MPTLEFKGKQHIYAHHLTVPYRPLVTHDDRSLNPGGADDNLIIHGDNLDALKALLPRYAGRVKCIYPGFPILGVFRLKGQSKRDGSIIVRSCKASLSPVYPIRDAIPAVNHASCPSLSSSGPPPMG